MIKFNLDKKKLTEIIECFKPSVKEKLLQFKVQDGNITILVDDMGSIMKYEMGNEAELDTEIKEFYINIDVLKNINSAVKDSCVALFEIKDEYSMKVTLDSTVLDMSLPYTYTEIDTEFNVTEGEVEEMVSDRVAMICNRLKTVKNTGITAAPKMEVGSQISMGNQVAYTVIKEGHGLEKLDFLTIPEFFTFFSNIYKFGDEVEIALDRDKERVRLRSGCASYYIKLMGDEVDKIEVEEGVGKTDNNTRINRDFLAYELLKLSIPLAGGDQSIRNVKLVQDNGELLLEVKDLGNKISDSRIKVPEIVGDVEVKVSIDRLRECIDKLEEDFEMRWNERALVVEDEVQKTFIVSYE